MEEYKTFIEIVTELMNRGYSIDFSELENVLYGFHKAHSLNIPPEDFLIDEVYCCDDDEEAGLTYIFAISSRKYRFKGIVINGIADDNAGLLSGVIKKIGKGLARMFNPLKPQAIKSNTGKNKR